MKTPRFITFMRHLRTRIDPDVPPSRWSLADDPAADLPTIADRCRELKVTSIKTSPEPKAAHTAAYLAAAVGAPCAADARLAEVDRDAGAFLEDYPASVALYLTRDPAFIEPWEPYEHVQQRIRSLLADLSTQDGRPLIVTHGLLMSICLAPVMKQSAVEFWKSLTFGHMLTLPAESVFDVWLD